MTIKPGNLFFLRNDFCLHSVWLKEHLVFYFLFLIDLELLSENFQVYYFSRHLKRAIIRKLGVLLRFFFDSYLTFSLV